MSAIYVLYLITYTKKRKCKNEQGTYEYVEDISFHKLYCKTCCTSEIQEFEVLNILVYFQDLPQWGSLGWDNYKGHQCSSPHDIHLAPCKRIKAVLYRMMLFFSRR